MAEKGFGVKEINLIGASGTPTIESPNNLNLNAVNVAISTNVSIGGTLAVTGNVSVGGTLTYEDVTNIDSVGVITARSGVDVDDFITVGSNIQLGNAGIITAITFAGAATRVDTSAITTNNIHSVTFQGSGSDILAKSGVTNEFQYNPSARKLFVSNITGFYNSPSYDTALNILGGANVTGVVTATSFSGSGANLTSLPAATPTNSDIQVAYTVTANGSSAYRFAGNGVVSTEDDPNIYLIRGQKYRFINNSGGSHPFQIRSAIGGSAYSTGVTNNGGASGNIDFAVPYDAPANLFYQCTSHSGMVGNLYIRGAGGPTMNVGVTTFVSGIDVGGSAGINISSSGADLTMNSAGGIFTGNGGNASNPIVANVSDTNTGFFYPAADTIAVTTGGSEKLRITSDGEILTPQQVGIAVRLSSNQSHPGNNSFENSSSIMNFDTEVWDIGSNFNTSTKTFTAPVAGRYLCCYTIQIETITNWLWLYIYPVVNASNSQTQAKGVVYADMGGNGVTGNTTTTAAYQMFSNTVVMNLSANDAVTLRTRGQISGTIKSGAETQWTMQLLG